MKKSGKSRARIGVIVLAAVVALHFPVWRCWKYPYEWKFYTTEEMMELAYTGTVFDRWKVRGVMEEAMEAFSSFFQTEEEAVERFGELSRYAWNGDDFPDAVSESHDFKLLTAKCGKDSGYLWVEFSREAYNSSGEVISGSWDVRARWEIQKDEKGSWQVTDILEAP